MDLLHNQQQEKQNLIKELQQTDKKLQLISKPFGGYRNVLHIDDLHFEDPLLTTQTKQMLQVSLVEENLNIKFNSVAS